MKKEMLIPLFGAVIFLMLFIISEYILRYLNMFPYEDFLAIIEAGDFKEFAKLAEKVISMYVFFVLPIISFITTLLISLIVRRRAYLMATLSILPFYVTFLLIVFLTKTFYIYSLYALLMLIIQVVVGVQVSKYLKR